MLGVSIRTVDTYIKTQGLPYIKMGRNIRFVLESVVEWLQTLEKTRCLSDTVLEIKKGSGVPVRS